MTAALRDIGRCFQGEIPTIMATCSADGIPNLVHLSQVFLVDDEHVAISNQFLAKSAANLAANPVATLLCIDPGSYDTYRLVVRMERSETEGERFDVARTSIDAIAALTGMADVLRLRSIDVFRVVDVSLVPYGHPARAATP
ncbi:pyridoxamine 5'-phosphate oxidase family protein [soil metagenome]